MQRSSLYVVGAGPGNPDFLTHAAKNVLKAVDCIVVAERNLPLVKHFPNVVLMGKLEETLDDIEERVDLGSVAVLVSGDPCIFSYLKRIRNRFPDREIEVIPGLGSLQSFFAAIGESWNDASIHSVHGRSISPSRVAGIVAYNEKSVFFCGPDRPPSWICGLLHDRKFDGLEVIVGEKISYPDERIVRGAPAEFAEQVFDGLSLVLVRNPVPLSSCCRRPGDDEFLRGDVPMTRAEIRTIILDSLQLQPGSVVWDIGAGTGSVSIACSRLCFEGDVYAVERSAQALALIYGNKEKFRAFNLRVCEGAAPDSLKDLPHPTHVFVGGSGGNLSEILRHVAQRGGGIRVVVSGVTLSTVCRASEILGGGDFKGLDILQIGINRSKNLGNSLIMAAQNPVTLLSAWTGGDAQK